MTVIKNIIINNRYIYYSLIYSLNNINQRNQIKKGRNLQIGRTYILTQLFY